MVERKDNYEKINERFAFRFIIKNVGLKEYTMHNHSHPINEIVHKFYAHLKSGIQCTLGIVDK